MKIQSLFFFNILLVIILLSGCGDEKKTSNDSGNVSQGRVLEYTDQVIFLGDDGAEISAVRVAIADEPNERNQGLMDVNDLPTDAGMLFIFPNEEPRSFYMANTPLPLDIMFVSADSTIVRIHHNTSPFSSKQLLSGEPAQFVVETNGGYAVANDIREGMKIRF